MDVSRTIRDRPTAEGSERNPTMNHAQTSMIADPSTSTGHTQAGVAVCSRCSCVTCTAGESSRTSLGQEGQELLLVEDGDLQLLRLFQLRAGARPGDHV